MNQPEYIDTFIEAYVEAALWSETDKRDGVNEDVALDQNFGPEDVAAASMVQVRETCTDFVKANWSDLQAAETLGDYAARGEWTGAERAGHDFLLTRNHHGAGFWDRGLGDVGDRLTEACRPYGEVYWYVGDDGTVYES